MGDTFCSPWRLGDSASEIDGSNFVAGEVEHTKVQTEEKQMARLDELQVSSGDCTQSFDEVVEF